MLRWGEGQGRGGGGAKAAGGWEEVVKNWVGEKGKGWVSISVEKNM